VLQFLFWNFNLVDFKWNLRLVWRAQMESCGCCG
jgi:hypothetical protein